MKYKTVLSVRSFFLDPVSTFLSVSPTFQSTRSLFSSGVGVQYENDANDRAQESDGRPEDKLMEPPKNNEKNSKLKLIILNLLLLHDTHLSHDVGELSQCQKFRSASGSNKFPWLSYIRTDTATPPPPSLLPCLATVKTPPPAADVMLVGF